MFGHGRKGQLDVITPSTANHQIALARLDLHNPLDGGGRR
jgi:hypothetical protein